MSPRSHEIISRAVFILRIRKSIGRVMRAVMSGPNFRSCRSWPRSVTKYLASTNGLDAFKRSFYSHFRCRFSFCWCAKSSARQRLRGRFSFIALRRSASWPADVSCPICRRSLSPSSGSISFNVGLTRPISRRDESVPLADRSGVQDRHRSSRARFVFRCRS